MGFPWKIIPSITHHLRWSQIMCQHSIACHCGGQIKYLNQNFSTYIIMLFPQQSVLELLSLRICSSTSILACFAKAVAWPRASWKYLSHFSSYCFSLKILFCHKTSFSCWTCMSCAAISRSCWDCHMSPCVSCFSPWACSFVGDELTGPVPTFTVFSPFAVVQKHLLLGTSGFFSYSHHLSKSLTSR